MNKRFEAIDIVRGLTIAGMILVNNPGSWEYVYAPLLHAEFNGLTPTDLVFPFFVFIMGYSIALSLRKQNAGKRSDILKKICRRSLMIFLVGLALNWLGMAAFSHSYGFEHLRIPGVLQRLAVCYFVTASLAVLVKDVRKLIAGTLVVLILYALLLAMGNGYEFAPDNIALQVDLTVFSASHIYAEGGVPFEPEGIVSTIPAICHTMLAYLCAHFAHTASDSRQRRNRLLMFSAAMLLMFVITCLADIPLNKKMWSTSFVFCTSAICSLTVVLADIFHDKPFAKPLTQFFTIFGKNCIAIYVISDILAIAGGVTGASYWLYSAYCTVFSTYTASLLFAISFVLLNWLIAYVLHVRHIMIKL